MKFYDTKGLEVDLKQFEPGSLVVMRVTKEMDKDEWQEFVKNSQHISGIFEDHGLQVVLCPDWIEFKEWK